MHAHRARPAGSKPVQSTQQHRKARPARAKLLWQTCIALHTDTRDRPHIGQTLAQFLQQQDRPKASVVDLKARNLLQAVDGMMHSQTLAPRPFHSARHVLPRQQAADEVAHVIREDTESS